MLSKNQYVSRFYLYHLSFIRKWQLFATGQKVWVSLSGGADSVALLLILCRVKAELGLNLHSVHFNHGVRSASEAEERFVVELCQRLKVPLEIKKLSFGSMKNFEAEARKQRYEFLKGLGKGDDVIATGHHLDDSFEWSLMMRFKGRSLSSALGIPLANGRIRRPLLGVARAHIEKFLILLGQNWCEDQSNRDTYYERNYIRAEIIPKIKERFPCYLKHYVHQSLLAAEKEGLLYKTDQAQHGEQARPWSVMGAVLFEREQLSRQGVQHCIETLSELHRGVLAKSIEQFLAGAKDKKWGGPHRFSGGVSAVWFGQWALFYNRAGEDSLKKMDEQWWAGGRIVARNYLRPFLFGVIKTNRKKLVRKDLSFLREIFPMTVAKFREGVFGICWPPASEDSFLRYEIVADWGVADAQIP